MCKGIKSNGRVVPVPERAVKLKDFVYRCDENKGLEAAYARAGELCVIYEEPTHDGLHGVWCAKPTDKAPWPRVRDIDLSGLKFKGQPLRITAAATCGERLFLLASRWISGKGGVYYFLDVDGKSAQKINNPKKYNLEGLVVSGNDCRNVRAVNDDCYGRVHADGTQLCSVGGAATVSVQ